MEFVAAGLALHRRETSVRAVHDRVADVALFDTLHLAVDVLLPHQDGGDDVSVTRLQQVANRQGPVAEFLLLDFETLSDVNLHRLKWVVCRNLDLQLALEFT